MNELAYARQRIGPLECVVAVSADLADHFKSEPPDALVILCHGFGAGGTDLVPCAGEIMGAESALKRTMFVFPAAPLELDPHFDSRAWWHIDIARIQSLQMTGEFRELRSEVPERLELCRIMIVEIIEQIREAYALSSEQVIVGGFSQGAMLTTEVALNYRDPLGGLIAWSGTLINEKAWKLAADGKASLRIFQSHGQQDPILPFAGAETLRDLLQQAGHELEFVPFEGQHEIPRSAIDGAAKMLREVVQELGSRS